MRELEKSMTKIQIPSQHSPKMSNRLCRPSCHHPSLFRHTSLRLGHRHNIFLADSYCYSLVWWPAAAHNIPQVSPLVSSLFDTDDAAFGVSLGVYSLGVYSLDVHSLGVYSLGVALYDDALDVTSFSYSSE